MKLISIITATILLLCAASDKIPDRTVPHNFGINIKDESSSTRDIVSISKLGAGFIRKGVYWDRVEQEKGVYDFSWYDRLIKDAEDNGLRILAILFGGNELYEKDSLGGIQTKEGRRGFAAFGAALAKHYIGHDIIWEIWNEPNTRTFWNWSGEGNSDIFADEYTALVKEITAAMLMEDPECFVVAGSVSNFWEPSYYWTNACFERGIGETGIRGWSVHPYGVKTPEEYAKGYIRTREIFVDNNIPEDFPILNTERGFSLVKLDEGWSGGDDSRAEKYQAWHLVRQYMVDLLYDIRLSIWYEWDAEKFGVMNGDEKRPSYYACKNMIDELNGYSFKEKLYTSLTSDYLLLFENTSGKQKLVAWTAPNAGETPDKFETHTVEIPLKIKKKVIARDIYGRKMSPEKQNNRVQIELTGSPVYISY